ncbi:DUF1178 family protein [Noviherbaspirillum galbum]|uniref:DUF1178 family protein n=1 Tax=Noviherbaspirillum galbum TaxID=2709383 RepID=A0A6B3SPW6_9BURK|nr:DUF1178 family protein [Noviherbaspirillum galbum]NEX62803.1 DUF1178 family protein [Noviherbaspirillum galbum]
MKVYNLKCEHEHAFEGWFSSEDDFLRQSGEGLIACPLCASCKVVRMPSAPRLNLGATQAPGAAPSGAQPTPEQRQALLLSAIRQIIAITEDVGERFAEEARRIHHHEAPDRAIRGVASLQECEALVDEGIEVAAFPLPDALKQPMH